MAAIVIAGSVAGAVLASPGFGLGVLVATVGVSLLLRREEEALVRAELSEAETRERESELALLVRAMPGLIASLIEKARIRLWRRDQFTSMSRRVTIHGSPPCAISCLSGRGLNPIAALPSSTRR